MYKITIKLEDKKNGYIQEVSGENPFNVLKEVISSYKVDMAFKKSGYGSFQEFRNKQFNSRNDKDESKRLFDIGNAILCSASSVKPLSYLSLQS